MTHDTLTKYIPLSPPGHRACPQPPCHFFGGALFVSDFVGALGVLSLLPEPLSVLPAVVLGVLVPLSALAADLYESDR